MSGWEDKLIADLERAAREKDLQTAGAGPVDPVRASYEAAHQVFQRAIGRICDALGLEIDCQGKPGEDRVRWTYGVRTLALRYDAVAARYFVTVDLGRDLAIDDVSLAGSELVDGRGRPVTPEALAERFVTLLFRGSE